MDHKVARRATFSGIVLYQVLRRAAHRALAKVTVDGHLAIAGIPPAVVTLPVLVAFILVFRSESAFLRTVLAVFRIREKGLAASPTYPFGRFAFLAGHDPAFVGTVLWHVAGRREGSSADRAYPLGLLGTSPVPALEHAILGAVILVTLVRDKLLAAPSALAYWQLGIPSARDGQCLALGRTVPLRTNCLEFLSAGQASK